MECSSLPEMKKQPEIMLKKMLKVVTVFGVAPKRARKIAIGSQRGRYTCLAIKFSRSFLICDDDLGWLVVDIGFNVRTNSKFIDAQRSFVYSSETNSSLVFLFFHKQQCFIKVFVLIDRIYNIEIF